MTSVVMTGRSIKGWDRFIVRALSAFSVLGAVHAPAAAGHLALAAGTGLTLGASDADLGAGNDAQLAIDDHLVAFFQIAQDRVVDAVVEQDFHGHLLGGLV